MLVARASGRPVGCGGLRFHGDGRAEVKRMWVAPEARGHRARTPAPAPAGAAGRETPASTCLRLETNGSLREAIALYRESGYREVAPFNDEPYAHHWFAKRSSAVY